MTETRYRSYPVVDDMGLLKGFISRYHLISPKRKQVILLDHNERAQTIDGIEEAEILKSSITTGWAISKRGIRSISERACRQHLHADRRYVF